MATVILSCDGPDCSEKVIIIDNSHEMVKQQGSIVLCRKCAGGKSCENCGYPGCLTGEEAKAKCVDDDYAYWIMRNIEG